MRGRRELKLGAWVVAAVVIAAASYFAGGSLKPDEDPYYVFDTAAPAYQAPRSFAATSPGGFTGFDVPGPDDSRTVIAGRVVELTEGSLTLESAAGQQTQLSFGESPRITRLEPGSRELLQPGVTVSVRLAEDGATAVAVLVTSQP